MVESMGTCIATDRITVEGKGVGYMYREMPDDEEDSGWRFFAGDETDDYANDPTNLELYDVNTIANYDAAIIPYLGHPPPCAFERVPNMATFTPVEM
ncbi:MAG: DUF2185 domain-containing protein [Alphaproteobacteria bacterium]|nr:DUF2185 domain-containing protein [Alphaproteobacteria bacterium]MBL6936748.1 DUF2185 domain-containing protein [Alphaproteobacteria bacterium]MBL7097517.1 DUF2185 domain-containing protein [Alphaproteobacteria bacterium]